MAQAAAPTVTAEAVIDPISGPLDYGPEWVDEPAAFDEPVCRSEVLAGLSHRCGITYLATVG